MGGFPVASIAGRNRYLAALTLAIGAIAIQLLAKHHAGLGMMTMARGAEALHFAKRYAEIGKDTMARAETDESKLLAQTAMRHAYRSDLWGSVSLGLALLAVVCGISARRHREPGSQGVLLALLSVYLLLLLLVV
jgi:hypothetical protein